ncbi:hypothetical protein QBC34DRAFT_70703 [Podospora aff. communis PSN243]|uniref:XRCC4 coiled-coil domain-containing protein n=1 Tax=Podospora aff. communis PSN243 TaxID=3040156 RepID=A0AAV9H808_9PEZI|nr:hypothetical protein QBC34DRAFT_70703 [Podospora aff. communis PSN243]
MATRIIRIPRTDTTSSETAFILGEVGPPGSKPLNVKVVATEGECPYVVKLRHDRVDELRVSNSPCSPEEWERILKGVLFGEGEVEGIEAGAEVKEAKTITVTVRRRVAGINQRLGTITLSYKEDEGIQLYDWCGNAMLANEKLKSRLADETSKVSDLETCVLELKNQLDELTQAKKTHESELLEKFCLLLNEKKVKIREQQRLLSEAMVDPARVAAVVATRQDPSGSAPPASSTSPVKSRPASSGKGRVPKASRAGKRKARPVVPSDDDSDDDGFEKMDVDKKTPGPSSSSRLVKAEEEEPVSVESDTDEAQETPGNATETGSDSDSEDLDSQPVRKPTAAEKGKGRATASPPSRAAKGKGKQALTMQPKRAAAAKRSVSPAPAQAAVARHRAAAAAPPPATVEGSETESDDEL